MLLNWKFFTSENDGFGYVNGNGSGNGYGYGHGDGFVYENGDG
jgi:hypothetical protein